MAVKTIGFAIVEAAPAPVKSTLPPNVMAPDPEICDDKAIETLVGVPNVYVPIASVPPAAIVSAPFTVKLFAAVCVPLVFDNVKLLYVTAEIV